VHEIIQRLPGDVEHLCGPGDGQTQGLDAIMLDGQARVRGIQHGHGSYLLVIVHQIDEGFWMGLQSDYDLEEARRHIATDLSKVERVSA